MALARGFEPKTSLTPREELKAACLHLIYGLSQQTLTVVFDGVNGGRIAEAVDKVRIALNKDAAEADHI